MRVEFGPSEFIDDISWPGAQIQHFALAGTDYGALFVPRTAWDDSTAIQVSRELGIGLPPDAYEIKFDTLESLYDTHPAHGFRTRAELGLPPYTLKELNLLGGGLLASIDMFDKHVTCSGYYGCAVDDNLRLSYYYMRLYRRYGAHFKAKGLEPYTSTGGTCYAFLRR
ncbi:hypothetical protein [Vreelandella subglaciescola]|jgi:hypothetical protein|uniref:Uncharacterized protein n=1 Tax=Vreelandella subglaciescola TaxID=29571 RepID=A0A1M7GVR2_9GAMM|nr:hypothetical protein [Halomonas subglaciescola]SHM20236.1 hypothetical protein SAMN05878437_1751 [Halomonas subglaciescola]